MLRIVMKIKRKTIVILLITIVFLAVLIAVLFIARGNVHKQKNIVNALQDSVDLQIKGFVYTEVGKGIDKMEVKAESATYDKKQNRAVLKQVRMKLITSDGKVFEMKADSGRLLTDTRNIEINGNVVLNTDAGDRFFTDYIKYSDAEKKFHTDAPVIMESKRIRITGRGLIIYLNRGELKIPAMVRAKIN